MMDAGPPDQSPRLTALPGVSCQNVLCWVGSFDKPDPVVLLAQALAQQNHGICQVVLGLDSPYRFRKGLSDWAAQTPLTPEIISRAERRLASLYGDDIRTMVLLGHPVTEVRRFARNHRIDLIVMGRQAMEVEQHYGEQLDDPAPCTIMILLFPRRTSEPARDPNRRVEGNPKGANAQ
jgi:hypothetical protein